MNQRQIEDITFCLSQASLVVGQVQKRYKHDELAAALDFISHALDMIPQKKDAPPPPAVRASRAEAQ